VESPALVQNPIHLGQACLYFHGWLLVLQIKDDPAICRALATQDKNAWRKLRDAEVFRYLLLRVEKVKSLG
jgi:hypothetical protein